MGKDVYFVVIKNPLCHEPHGRICWGWNYEPDDEDKAIAIRNLAPAITSNSNCTPPFDYNIYDMHENIICPVCKWFYNPCTPNPEILIDSYNIYHKHSHPSCKSLFGILRLMSTSPDPYLTIGTVGTIDNDYLHEIGPVKALNIGDVQKLENSIAVLGSPKRTSDKLAHAETVSVIAFLKKWTSNDQVKILYFDDGTP